MVIKSTDTHTHIPLYWLFPGNSDVHETFQAETETRPETQRSETETRRSASETRPRPRLSSCRDLDRDVWYMKIIQHNKIRINWTLLSSSGMTVFNDLLTAFNALSQWTSLNVSQCGCICCHLGSHSVTCHPTQCFCCNWIALSCAKSAITAMIAELDTL